MRYERKYKISGFGLLEVLQLLKTHPAGFRKIHPDRQVNNIYFDTPLLEAFHDNVAGVGVRQKIRLRWYGQNMESIANARLETKYKNNELGGKTVLPFGSFNIGDLPQTGPKVSKLCQTRQALQPVLLNAYQRQYYATPSALFRITVDHNLRYHSLLAQPRFHRFAHSEPAIVLELKYDEKHDGLTDPITQYLPFRQTKSSKYVTGVELTNA